MKPPSDSLSALLAEPRRLRTLAWIQKAISVRLRDLVRSFQVPKATIRQDLPPPGKDGSFTRKNGGTFLASVRAHVSSVVLRHNGRLNKKRKIGAWAAYLLGQGIQRLTAP